MKGQIGIIAMVGLFIGLLIIAPILLNIVRTTTNEFADALNTTNPNAATQVNSIEDSFTGFWDWVLVILFGLNVIMVFISAFFIDTHPAFVLIYIMMAFFLMVFAPNMLDAVDEVWAQPQYSTETGMHLAGTDFVRTHFGGIILSILILSGIIMYAKFKYFSSP